MRPFLARSPCLLALCLLGCAPSPEGPPPDDLPPSRTDGGRREAGLDAGPGALPDAAPGPDAAPRDGGSVPAPLDCSVLAARHSLCEAGPDRCAIVFGDGSGCAAACASAGLICAESHEDLAGACAPDLGRPPLGCVESGHASDHCVCVRDPACVPSCDGRACGTDGCGGACGDCGPAERCEAGACVAGPSEDCRAYPFSAETLLAERVGFGAASRGGDPARIYRVTTLRDGGAGSLRAALESDEPWWIVFDVEGTITHRTAVEVRSRKTVDGRGRDVHLQGELRMSNARDIILADLRLSNDLEGHCTQAGDVIVVRGRAGARPEDYTSRDIWLHHVELFNGGDGLFDVRGGSGITVSWSHFHTHKKGMLLAEDLDDRPAPGMRLTFHHNFFDRLTLRGPLLRYGWAHFFNNYQYRWYEHGAASLETAQFLSEANVYEARPGTSCGLPFAPDCPDPNPCGDSDWEVSKEGLVTDWGGAPRGYTRSVADLALEGAVLDVNEPSRVFDAHAQYRYAAEAATPALAARIRDGAGPRVSYCR